MSFEKIEQLLTDAAANGKADNEALLQLQEVQGTTLTGSEASKLNIPLETLVGGIADADATTIHFILEIAAINPPGQVIRQGLEKIITYFFAEEELADLVTGLVKPEEARPSDAAGRLLMFALFFAEEIAAGHRIFPALKKEELTVFHKANGFGLVHGYDKTARTVEVTYRAKIKIPFDKFFSSISLILPGSIAADLARGGKINSKSVFAAELKEQFKSQFLPEVPVTNGLLARLLMPTSIKSINAFEIWVNRKGTSAAVKTKTTEKGGDLVICDKWKTSRSLAELKLFLDGADAIEIDMESIARLLKIFTFAANKPNQVEMFIESFNLLWNLSDEKEMLIELAQSLKDKALVWRNFTVYVDSLNKLKVAPSQTWVEISAHACGLEFFADNCIHLPSKQWITLSKAFGKDGDKALFDGLQKYIQAGEISTDALLWVWGAFSNDREKLDAVFTNPTVVFRALNYGESGGAALKSKKELKKLLMKDDTFIDYMAAHGDEAAVANLISAVRSMSGLEDGERKVLLVRIVRLYPNLKHLVEAGSRSKTKKTIALPRITSPKSYLARKEELDDIVTEKIPKNAKAIGVARDHGDLRENFEFRAAKDEQKLLQSRRAELEGMLDEVKPSDFSEFDFSGRVMPGTIVTLSINDTTISHTILGLWDSSPEDNILSFETPLAKLLIGKSAGAELTLPNGDDATIEKVEEISEELRSKIS